MKKIIIAALVLAVAALAVLLTAGKTKAPEPIVKSGAIVTILYQNNAFNPAIVQMKAGDTVEFFNNHIAPIRIHSGPHPIHTSYPELASGSLEPGESYQFTADRAGIIGYHNHFHPSAAGEIIVK
ncbi:MAG: hypothetical protein AAB646_01360 [Patescibacteria group bacterium]